MALPKLVRHLCGMTFLFPVVALAQVPIGEPPQWVEVLKEGGRVIDYEAKGVYTKGDYTYVALRETLPKDPANYSLVVHAFNCSKKSVSVALLGQMALDGTKRKHGNMNEEKLLAKYSDPLPSTEYAYLTPVQAAVCGKR